MNEIYPAIYTAEVWNAIDGIREKIKGVTFGHDFTEAMTNIEAFYGEELISVSIELQESQTVWEIDRSEK